MGILLKDIPGLEASVEAASKIEIQRRELAFLDVNVDIAGVEARQMTLRHFLLLDSADVPFFAADILTEEEAAMFLWVVSPMYRPPSADAELQPARKGCKPKHRARRGQLQRKQFMAEVAKLPLGKVRAGIKEHVEVAFMDAPRGGRGGAPATCFAAALIDRMVSSGYPWDEDQFLDLPLGRVFQYLRRITIRDNPQCVPVNPLSDRVRREMFEAWLKTHREGVK